MSNYIFALLCFVLTTFSVRGEPLYAVVAHGKLVPNTNYLVTVSIRNATNETDVSVAVKNQSSSNENVVAAQKYSLQSNDTKIMVLLIPNLNSGKYVLNVIGEGAVRFNHTEELNLEVKRLSALIQTDKAMYKPKQKVKFRIVILDEELRPVDGVNTTVQIKDANKNIVKRSEVQTLKSGIISEELLLSDEPVLGDWEIIVDLGKNRQFSKKITVAEYVLPAFTVDLSLPAYSTKNASKIIVSVKATYTYGKPVKGEVTLKVIDFYGSWVQNRYEKRNRYEISSKINGEINIDVESQLLFDKQHFSYLRKYEFVVSVKDELTQKVYNKTQSLSIFENDYTFELIKNVKFRPGFKYVNYIKVSYRDETPVENSNHPLKIKYGYGWNRENRDQVIEVIPVNGIAKFELNTNFSKESALNGTNRINVYEHPYVDQSMISMDVEYKGVDAHLASIFAEREANECFINLHDVNEEFDKTYKYGEELSLQIESNKAFDEFVYQIVGRNGALFSEKISVPSTTSHIFNVKINKEMYPSANVVVYIFCDASIAVQSFEMKMDGLFRNFVNVSTNVKETKPGAYVDIKIASKLNSYVAILGIDQRTLLLKSGNDIEKSMIESDMRKSLGCNGFDYFSSCVQHSLNWRYWYSASFKRKFKESGFYIFTNKVDYDYKPYWRHGVFSPRTGLPGPSRLPEISVTSYNVASKERQPEINIALNNKPKYSASKKIKPLIVRKHFPETWIWEVVELNETATKTVTKKVPDAITSWFITAFSTNNEFGLGLIDEKALLKVFRPFFIKLSLPYSVIRGETVAIKVTVFNYMNNAQQTEVKMENSNKEFDFVIAESEENEISQSQDGRVKNVVVPANDGLTTTFLIKPKKVGYMKVKLSAVCDKAADAISDQLLVKAEGETKYRNEAMLLKLNSGEKFSKQIRIEMPRAIVADSERVTVTAIGDTLGPAINNLDDLLRMPYGCGEQNMINFVPNIVVANYLTNAGKLSETMKKKAISHMERGYQRELTYKHSDGSFSAFGERDRHGSTWLTAFVVKSFIQAKPFINIDEQVIDKGVNFLLSKQAADGSFFESGRVLSRSMQSKSGANSASLTAYVFIALITDPTIRMKYSQSLEKSEAYLISQLENSTDVYETSIITYALHLFDSSYKDVAFGKLMRLANKKQEYTSWTNGDSKTRNSANVEITSYALMTLMKRDAISEALPVLRFLISNQNSRGGFSSTQDTVIGIQALASFATRVSNKNPSLNIEITSDEHPTKSISVNKQNSMVLQELRLLSQTKLVTISASGEGSAIVQVSWQYNVMEKTAKPAFAIRYEIDNTTSTKILHFRVFVKFTAGKESGMTVMEISLPSGYTADLESLHEIKKSDVKRVETKAENTVVVVYFDALTESETSVPITAIQNVKMADLKPVPIIVYDYYEKSKSATIFFQSKQVDNCDICENDDCGRSCRT
ncbi:CD109 antigen-like protein [Dinothrombium tinctorium]|uniref:TEP1-F n=1 Tax=Dinothrombium tinctorium TaxID=1965070 RepID=A0A443R7M4_9ACAR|nr:CD109 antigen-like protein [Dinothrombium tinctorium]